MIKTTNQKLGAFIVPTGVGSSIGGFAGDASTWAREFSKYSQLIINPNVVNAGCFSGINDNMLYVEGYSLNEFFKGNLKLIPSIHNKIGLVVDKSIPQDVINIHLNTMRAVQTVYGINIINYEITKENVGVKFKIENSGISTGYIENISTLLKSAQNLQQQGCNAIGLICLFDNPEDENEEYANGEGVDPVGGVEAILSHYISKETKLPCVHSPAFTDYQIYPELVNAKAAAEYITPTFLPCILLGLNQAPQLSTQTGISIDELDYLIMPYNSLGCVPVFECLKRNIPVFAIKENKTVLNISPEKISKDINVFETYNDCLNYLKTL